MAAPKSNKRERERARADKAKAKQARRRERADVTEEPAVTPAAEQSELLAELAELHRRFADEEIGFDEFEAAREELTQRLVVG